MADALRICEVGLRDGLQSQAVLVGLRDKQRLVELLFDAGLREMEITSFVSPRAVPQLADADSLMPWARSLSGLSAFALVLNEQGYARALAAGCRAITLVIVCSETLALKNNRRPSHETLETARKVVALARRDGVAVRACLAAAWHCPYDGKTDPGRVLGYAAELWEMGISELSLADTIGHAHPREVGALARRLVESYGPAGVSVHLHDTEAFGLANAFAAIEAGVRKLDASVGGLGGCPFAKGAAGNLATEDLVALAHRLGFDTGVDLDRLWRVVEVAEALVHRPTGGRTKAYWLSKRERASTSMEAVTASDQRQR